MGDYAGFMTAVNPDDGTIKWQFCAPELYGTACTSSNQLNVAVQAGPALDPNGRLAYGGWDGRFYILEEAMPYK